MNNKKIKRLVASLVFVASVFSNTLAYGAVSNTSTSTVSTSVNESDENVLKVNIDDQGNLTYAEPVSAVEEVVNDENKPFSWDNVTAYFVLTDRFNNADTTNDHSYGRGLKQDGVTPQVGLEGSKNTSNPGTFHGGDLKGLTAKLNSGYFTDLGVNAIWITSPLEQMHGYTSGHVKGDQGQAGEGGGFPYYGYHGYWSLDTSNIDANMGTEADFATFVDTAHTKGIRVIMDIVLNHTGYVNMYDATEYGYGSLKAGWEAYYFGDVDKLSGGLPENQTWYDFTSSNWSKWYGADYVRTSSPLTGYTIVSNGNSETAPLCGLPDIKTESTTEIGIPTLLVTKWTKEGRLAKESAELDKFFSTQKLPKTARNYTIKWLTDWVREYGVDGFRCDTAKHVEMAAWKSLQEQSDIALKEWRVNNPTKAGAKWTDDFWMTGEAWGHGAGRSAYFDNGFESMVNFTFPKDGSTANLEGTYSNYAGMFNSPASDFNVLSYISSHDTALGARGNLIGGGTALLLTPGGAQIFYGDESGRKLQWTDFFTGSEYKDQSVRSDMNWTSMDAGILSHWQKLGQFRSNHISVGAGEHKQLSASPYTFSRIYAKDGVTDRVVCAVGVTGTTSITVEGVFSDNAKVRDFYTGQMYTVSGGKVSVTPGTNGVVLLEKGDKSPDVGVSPSSQTYYSDSLDLALSVSNDANATYSIDGGTKKTFTNGQKITIGAGLDFGTTTTITVEASNADGSAGPSTYTYLKDDPTNKMVKIHFKRTGWTSPNVYVYSGEGATAVALAGAWPGKAMTDEGNGWYSYQYIGESSARVVFNAAGKGQDPVGSTTPGYLVEGEMTYEEGVWSKTEIIPVVKPTISSLTPSLNSPQVKGTNISLSTSASGGTGALTYQYEVNANVVQAYSSNSSFSWTPITDGTYSIKVSVKDASGNTVSKTITYVIGLIDNPNLTITSFATNIASPQVLGNTITLNTTASGGTGTLQTRYSAFDGLKWTMIKNYSTAVNATWTPTKAGTYQVWVDAKDAAGKVVSKVLTYVISPTQVFKIDSFAAGIASPQTTGKAITLNAQSSGGVGIIQTRYSAFDGLKWTMIKNYSTVANATWTPTKAGTYQVWVDAKDAAGKVVSKVLTYVINPSTPITFSSITTNITSPQNVGATITIKANATSGLGKALSYKYWIFDIDGNWKLLKDSTIQSSATWYPTEAGKYLIWVDVRDNVGNSGTKYIEYTVN